MKIDQILAAAVRGNASDVVLKTGVAPRFRFNSDLVSSDNGVAITQDIMNEWLKKIIPPHLQGFSNDCDFSYESSNGFRFRMNVFKQRGCHTIVARVILNHIRTLEELHLPNVLLSIASEHRGLVLITGVTGSGKSTTLAAMIDYINRTRAAHIITIEDPIEYLITDQKSVVEQREVGIDTESFASAMRAAMRQNPDVIMVGEMRDRETAETALRAAETGHLVFSTLHTSDAVSSLTRIKSLFSASEASAVSQSLGQSLKGIISQRLLPAANNLGMVPALEVLIGSAAVRSHIAEGKDFSGLQNLIREGGSVYGMQTFDDSLASLVADGSIRKADALEYATSKGALELKLAGIGK